MLEIYNWEVRNSTSTFDVDPAAELVHWSPGFPCLVDLDPETGVVRGYSYLGRYRDRAAFDVTAEIAVYVHKGMSQTFNNLMRTSVDHRRHGIARALAGTILAEAKQRGFHSVVAVVCSENSASVALLHGLCFETVGVLRQVGQKFGRLLDVTMLQLLL